MVEWHQHSIAITLSKANEKVSVACWGSSCQEASAANCTEIFSALNDMAMQTNIILFDDLDDIVTDKIFSAALQAYIDDTTRRKVFLVLIHNKSSQLDTLELISRIIVVPYCSIAEIKKSCPERTGQEALLLYTLSGGIPEIINNFDGQGADCLLVGAKGENQD